MVDSRAKLNADLTDLAKRYAAEARERLGDQIVSIALYGSVARGEAGPASDIDLLVIFQNATPGMLSRRRLLDPVRESLTPDLERLWREGIYIDFVEVIRTRSEAEKFHPLYLDMSQEAVLLYDRDGFLEKVLAEVGEELERGERSGNSWETSGFGTYPAHLDHLAHPVRQRPMRSQSHELRDGSERDDLPGLHHPARSGVSEGERGLEYGGPPLSGGGRAGAEMRPSLGGNRCAAHS